MLIFKIGTNGLEKLNSKFTLKSFKSIENYTLEQLKMFLILFLEIFIKTYHKPECNQLYL